MVLQPRIPRLLQAFVLVLAFAACSDSGDPVDPGDGGGGTFNGTIRVVDNQFIPRDVTISAGDSITWSFQGNAQHTVTEGTSPNDPSHLFDSPLMSSGTFGYHFTSEGLVNYFCRPHFAVNMRGTITVNP
jgi:plastocyanin